MTSGMRIVLILMCSLTANADDWPQFLGPHRNGVSAETGLVSEWPDGGLKELWRVECVGGLSGIAVADNRAITMTQNRGLQSVAAFDVATGKRLWRTPVAPAYRNQQGDGPRATPTIRGDRVFAFTGDGVLSCLEAKGGQLVWSRPVVSELGGKPADYGMASSPLVYEDLVIVTAGVPGACVVACDEKTGEIRWKSGEDRAGYSSAVVATVHDQPVLLALTASSLSAMNPASGEVLWRHSFPTEYDCNTATPVVFENQVLISAGENHGSVLLKVTGDGVSEVWNTLGPRSSLRAEWQTPFLIENYLYGFDNVGSAGPVTHLTCIDARTGLRVWRQPRFGKGNFTLADGKLWVTTMKGEIVLVEPTHQEFRELGRRKYLGMTRQAPAISNGRLFARDEKHMICLQVRSS